MTEDSRYETFEVELRIRDGADVSAMDIKKALDYESADFQVRRVEKDGKHGPDYDMAWGDC